MTDLTLTPSHPHDKRPGPRRLDRARDASAAAVRESLEGHGTDVAGIAFRLTVLLMLFVALGVLVWLLTAVIGDSLPVFRDRGVGGFLSGRLSSSTGTFGVSEGIFGSVAILVFVAVLAVPLGIAAAVYLEEYARDNWFTRFVSLCIRNLAGVPSIVYGILGLFVFKETLGSLTGGSSLISAGLTMSILVLPIVIITSAEAIRAVPGSLREAGFGVGATRWEVVRSHVLPYAAPGMLTGTVLSLARALGEAAPLVMLGVQTGLAGNSGSLWDRLHDKFTALPALIFVTTKRPKSQGWPPYTAATIVVLLAVLLVASALAVIARNHFEKKRRG